MRIRSPKDLHYPITVSALLKKPDDAVERSAPLFAYTYKTTVTESNKYGDEETVEKALSAEFQSELEGTLTSWAVKIGDVIDKPGVILLDIEEPCKHDIQFGGMCTNCGADMTLVNYNTTQRAEERAFITIKPRQTALKVTQDEAARVSEDTKKRLLSARKLSLVVDLDQTVIHATVDPTVAEWQKDEDNPNHAAVKDVRCFKMSDGGPAGRGADHYVKLRPGLETFLEEVSKKFELHIYTMGTGPYAQNIVNIIDPQHKLFGDRILSRDESGSVSLKKLHKLFPIDQRMVVIIDDRGDIWNWSPNLIKVNPYDFFVGIGDINSSFLPQRQDLGNAPPVPTVVPKPVDENGSSGETGEQQQVEPDGKDDEPPSSQATAATIDQQLLAMAGSDDPAALENKIHQQEEVIAAQLSDRPLLRQQEELDRQDEEEEKQEQNGDLHNDTPSESGSQRHRHMLLRDDDVELKYLQEALDRVHRAFYEEYERRTTGSFSRIAELRGDRATKARPASPTELCPDIAEIMPALKRQVLKDVVILFTGVIPQEVIHQTSDIGIWAQTFGAIVGPNLTRATTHVIAHKYRRTSKVRQAAKYPHIKIVTTQWLFDCLARWEKVDETPYTIEVERHTHASRELLPFEDVHDGMTPLDEDTDFATDLDEDDYAPPEALEDNKSPLEMTDKKWEEINDELAEFLETDGEDDDGSQSDTSMPSVQSNGTRSETPNGRKRKRGTESVETSDAETESDATVNSVPGSKLEHRKKRARNRTSALNNATSALSDQSSGLPSPDTTGPEEGHGLEQTNHTHDEELDDLDLEQALMDEFEKEEELAALPAAA